MVRIAVKKKMHTLKLYMFDMLVNLIKFYN